MWDGSYRTLYVDDVAAAEDTQDGLEVSDTEDTTVVYGVSSDGGLYIGASKDLEGGSFFSGLIDDVRIYRRVLSPQEIAALAQ